MIMGWLYNNNRRTLMFNKSLLVGFVTALVTITTYAQAENVPINGTVQSRCIIQTDSAGVFGNPNAHT